MGTLQFSSGCPYTCEFCDIPGLYGRQPRMKTPQQIIAELDYIFSQPNPPTTLYFVDDNFIGNRKAAKEMLPHLVEWQKKHHYPMQFACEATLNIAKQTEILELMQEANFIGMFVGIETPEADALNAMRKGHNNAVPMLESIRTLNSYGLEVTSGIILGLDSDGRHRAAAEGLHRRVEHPDADDQSAAGAAEDAAVGPPQARRPARKTRAREQRAVPAPLRRGGRDVAAMYRLCERPGAAVRALPPPGARDLCEPQGDAREGQADMAESARRRGARVAHVLYLLILSDFRAAFWKTAKHALKQGQIDGMFGVAFMGYHLIAFTREALRGDQNASYYSAKKRTSPMAVAKPPERAGRGVTLSGTLHLPLKR